MLILEGHTAPVLCVAYAPDSVTLASGSADGSVRFWDLGTGRPNLWIPDAGGVVLSLAFSPEGKVLAVGTHSQVALWGLTSQQPLEYLRGQRGGTCVVAFTPNSRNVVLAGYLDEHLSLWDLNDTSRYTALRYHRGGVLALAHAASSPWLVSAGGLPYEGEVVLWDLRGDPSPGLLAEDIEVTIPSPYTWAVSSS